MDGTEKHKKRFGLVGRNISYSFSRGYFWEKFENLGLADHSYENFDLNTIEAFPSIIKEKNICGLNVTIPYKQDVIPFLDEIDDDAKTIGAVNTITVTENGLKGYNTDTFGFQESLTPLLQEHHKKALVLGTGGASKAVVFVLSALGIEHSYVSRKPVEGQLGYHQLEEHHLQQFQIIINCSPVGTHPNVNDKPNIPYTYINKNHIFFDLIYNPEVTSFLKEGKKRGATVQNGLPMLQFQAEKAWEIWNAKAD